MATDKSGAKAVAAYIKARPPKVQKLLKQMRSTIRRAAPKATEQMGYGIPTFKLEGNLVHFAGFKSHIGFYPGPPAIRKFKTDLSGYKQSKGAIQFPFDEPLPLKLITKIVRFRVKQNLAKI